MRLEGKWIQFCERDPVPGKKTKVFTVINKESGTILGYVKWYGAWRQYSFFPEANRVFERQCLLDITRFIQDLMNERKLKKQLITN